MSECSICLLERFRASKGVLGFAWAQESECWIGLLEVSLGDREVLNVLDMGFGDEKRGWL